jgi:hypothetical protein
MTRVIQFSRCDFERRTRKCCPVHRSAVQQVGELVQDLRAIDAERLRALERMTPGIVAALRMVVDLYVPSAKDR